MYIYLQGIVLLELNISNTVGVILIGIGTCEVYIDIGTCDKIVKPRQM